MERCSRWTARPERSPSSKAETRGRCRAGYWGPFLDGDGELEQAPDEEARDVLEADVRVDVQVVDCVGQRPQRSRRLHSGETGADADVDAVAEGEVVTEIFAGGVELVGLGKTSSSRLPEP